MWGMPIYDKGHLWPTKPKVYSLDLYQRKKNLPTPILEDFLNLDFQCIMSFFNFMFSVFSSYILFNHSKKLCLIFMFGFFLLFVDL